MALKDERDQSLQRPARSPLNLRTSTSMGCDSLPADHVLCIFVRKPALWGCSKSCCPRGTARAASRLMLPHRRAWRGNGKKPAILGDERGACATVLPALAREAAPSSRYPALPSSSQRGTGPRQVRSPVQEQRGAVPDRLPVWPEVGRGRTGTKPQMPTLLSDGGKIPRNLHKEVLTPAPSAAIH